MVATQPVSDWTWKRAIEQAQASLEAKGLKRLPQPYMSIVIWER